MQTARRRFPFTSGNLVLLGVFLGAAFWFIDSFMDEYVFHELDFVQSVSFPGPHETWMRAVIAGMFILFGAYAQWMVNARRQARESLLIANRELTQIFETSADGLRVVDPDFNVLRASRTFSSLAGVTQEEIAGKKCYEVFSGPLCRTADCPLLRILNGEDRVVCDTERVHGSGRVIPCILTATPLRGPDGKLIGMLENYKDISERKRSEEELRQSRRRLRELAGYLESAREKERTRIAREIHDEVGQSLTALKMELHGCIRRLPPEDAPLLDKLSTLEDLIDENVALVQRIASELRPGLLDTLGLSSAIEWQAGQFQERTGIQCDILCEPHDIVLDPTCTTVMFRVFQESLTNIARHARATMVEVALRQMSEATELTVRDNGRGIREEEAIDPRSFGLMGMRERVEALAGTVAIVGSPGKGTLLTVRIPPDTGKEVTHAEDPDCRRPCDCS